MFHSGGLATSCRGKKNFKYPKARIQKNLWQKTQQTRLQTSRVFLRQRFNAFSGNEEDRTPDLTALQLGPVLAQRIKMFETIFPSLSYIVMQNNYWRDKNVKI
jgi:hypothetical protein